MASKKLSVSAADGIDVAALPFSRVMLRSINWSIASCLSASVMDPPYFSFSTILGVLVGVLKELL